MKKKAVLGMLLTLLLMAVLASVSDLQTAGASETIYIEADGQINPLTAPISSIDNVTYVFTSNIYQSIVVDRDNITIDGGGYTLHGTEVYDSEGISITGRDNITIRNMKILGFYYGIYIYDSSGSQIYRNEVTSNKASGIIIGSSSNNYIYENTLAENEGNGVYIYESSRFNRIIGNSIVKNGAGIHLEESHYNGIGNNSISKSVLEGVKLDESSYNSIFQNYVVENEYGIALSGNLDQTSQHNQVFSNDIKKNSYGIWAYMSSHNSIYDNNLTSNTEYGIDLLWWSPYNQIYHNSFVDNNRQVSSNSINTWDDGYPSGGNYWSDHSCADTKSGPGQDQPGSDGIGDAPYIITENQRDRYPIFRASAVRNPDPSDVYLLAGMFSIGIVGAILGYLAIRRKNRLSKRQTEESLVRGN